MKIRVYTKKRHESKIRKFLSSFNVEYQIFTIYNDASKNFVTDEFDGNSFDLGISYCYPRKILDPLLSIPKNGFINFHPGKLPEYKAPDQALKAIKNKETKWGVTAHYMDKDYDSGKIIEMSSIYLHEPPTDKDELMAVTHYFLFNLFKKTLTKFLEQGKKDT